jgi:putative ABC transport system permease protein
MSESPLLALDPGDEPVMGVLRLRSGAEPETVREKIAHSNLDDVIVMTREALLDREVGFTITAAPIGLLFGFGVIAGLVVGAMVCYQILFNEITDHLPQFATLRAMGYSDGFIRRIILEQAGLLSFAGFAVGIAAAAGVYYYVQQETALVMRITLARATFGFLLTVAMCVAGGLLAMRRVTVADPADLY